MARNDISVVSARRCTVRRRSTQHLTVCRQTINRKRKSATSSAIVSPSSVPFHEEDSEAMTQLLELVWLNNTIGGRLIALSARCSFAI